MQCDEAKPGSITSLNLMQLESCKEIEPEKCLQFEGGKFSACPKFIDDLAEFIDDKLDPETAAKTDVPNSNRGL